MNFRFLRPIALVMLLIAIQNTAETASAQTYSVIDLGDLKGGDDYSGAFGINRYGQVCGESSSADGYRGFFWDSTTGMQDIGVLPGGDDSSSAWQINNYGQVTGYSGSSVTFANLAIAWDATKGMQVVGDLPGGDDYSFGIGINDLGQVVGVGWTGISSHAFFWDPVSGMLDLGLLEVGPGFFSAAYAINNFGQVVGQSTATHGGAFLWDNVNGMQNLGTLPGDSVSSAEFINDDGQVVGASFGSVIRAFLWDNVNGMQGLGDLPGGDDESWAYRINNIGQVVGSSSSNNGSRAFLWDANHGMRDLNDLLDSSGTDWVLEYAGGINDAGQIVGGGYNPDGEYHAFLLTPNTFLVHSVEVITGVITSGSVTNLNASDDNDLTIARDDQSIQSKVVLVAKTFSAFENPAVLNFTLESSVFARGEVQQSIELFNYETQEFEVLDTRSARRFSDQIVTVTTSGDNSRFVNSEIRCMEARIVYTGNNPRLRFLANIDHVLWELE